MWEEGIIVLFTKKDYNIHDILFTLSINIFHKILSFLLNLVLNFNNKIFIKFIILFGRALVDIFTR